MKIVCPNPNTITKGNAGPVSITYTRSRPRHKQYTDATLATYHSLWSELHAKQDASPEWFEDWCGRVPQASCGCRRWLKDYIAENPPQYSDWFSWSVELHNAINAKLGREQWTRERAIEHYASIDRP